MPVGVVTRTEGPRLWVKVSGDEIPCSLRGRLRREQTYVSSPVVVGDEVEVDLLPDGGGAIGARLPRRTELSRPTSFRGQVHVIAANIDQLVIVQAALQPRFKLGLTERFLATARRGRMEAFVVINKCDLENESTIRAWVAPLAKGGVRVLLASALDGRGLEELRSLLEGRTSVLAGQSGVGKSSLLNALYPEASARTGDVAAWNGKGRHTTTASRLYALPDGGHLVDTPGIRELSLFDDDEEAVRDVFPDIEAFAGGCRFRDCTHSHEPGCAVKGAVERGEVDEERYRHYLRLATGR